MDGTNSNMLHYGFSSLDEEIAKDQLDAENDFRSGPVGLDSSSSGQDGVLQNVDPSVILDITGAGQQELLSQESQSAAAAHTDASAPVQVSSVAERKPKSAPRSRKRKSAKPLKDENAPKLPQTGYVMYMNERREIIKYENPNISFSELTKAIAAEWSGMDQKQKKKYLDTAEQNKAKYLSELAAYQQTDTYKRFQSKKQQAETNVRSKTSTQEASLAAPSPTQQKEIPTRMPGMDIPIFTEEFLDHNKSREKELRELRNLNRQYEEQNAILSKHVEDLKGLAGGLEQEANTQRNNNIALIQHLESLRETLATNFVDIPLPGEEVPTVATIDNYMTKLHQLILDAPQENQDLIMAVREIVNKLNLEAYVT